MAENRIQFDETINGWTPPIFPVAGSESLTATTSAPQSSAFSGEIVLVRTDTAGDYVAWGADPTATTTEGDANIYMFADEWVEIPITDGDKISAYGSGTLNIRYAKTYSV
jgi:hypothetical protein